MKLTLSWLREFIDIPTSDPEEIAEAFESLGHEIEEWHVIEPSFSGVVVGEVLEVAAHPNADKVRLTKVDVGDEVLDIVCGAWNFEAGAVVPVAVPGAVLAGNLEITRREIRGVISNGMICSEIELELGDEAEGIMVLNDDYPVARDMVGESFAPVLGFPDVYYEVGVTPNRPDCLSVYGLARDLAAFYDAPLRDPNIGVEESGPPSVVHVTIDDAVACPRFAGRQVRGITVGVSPHWLRRRLGQAGVRPISNVVDASNYAMIEFGHPTHAFDVDRLGDTIHVRMANNGESIRTLDDQERELTSSDIVVTDGSRIVAIGGVMGGAAIEVHVGTTDVFIEAAYWNPASILMTSKRLGLRSEASARFERGADPSFCPLGADRVAQLLTDIAGGSPAPEPVDVDPGQIRPWTVSYPLSETERILGIALDSHTTSDLLTRLGFDVSGTDPLVVTVPTRRPDVRAPVDLIEEIARLHGFDGIPDTVPQGPGGGLSYRERRMRLIRDIMVGAGYYQLIGFSFIGRVDLDRLGLEPGHPARASINIVNPLNETEGVMRTTLLPGLLKAASLGIARKNETARLYEIGKVFLPGTGKLPEQPDRLAFLLAGEDSGDWLSQAVDFDMFDGTGMWTSLADKLGIANAEIRQTYVAPFHPGRCAEIVIDDAVIGTVGEIHPKVLEAFDLSGRVVAAELDLDALVLERSQWQYTSPSAFPPVVFDLAFALDDDVATSTLLRAVQDGAAGLFDSVTVFDVFEGASIGEGRKSIAVRIHLRAPDRTLTDEEVSPVRKAIANSVVAATGGELRGKA
ncbi:MAG: phenylalanine--tRNA ligase subunit beta [Acidimicrobiia bacterium]|nr:MAG: phenylalanine--tRNA ligase subunit beta [Acidimicrobiia bacterium]